jgi:phage shock protein PspC (stress-responsive transcriptional regulator)
MSELRHSGQGTQLLTRAREGRWLGGVCAGLAPPRNLKVGWLRAAFALGALMFGLGAVVYAALWLILPLDPAAGRERRGLVVFAQACAGCAALAALGLLGAVATIFGFGWAVLGLGALVLICGLGAWSRTGPVWVLLPLPR